MNLPNQPIVSKRSAEDANIWAGLKGKTEIQRWAWAYFSPFGTMRREGYCGYGLVALLAYLPFWYVMLFVNSANLSLGFGILIWIPAYIAFCFQIKRIRSIGWPVWLAILGFAWPWGKFFMVSEMGQWALALAVLGWMIFLGCMWGRQEYVRAFPQAHGQREQD